MGRSSQLENFDAVKSDQSDHGIDVKDAYHTIAQLTMEGVLLFAAQSFAKGLFTLFITTMAFDFCGVADRFFSFSFDNPGILQRQKMKDNMHMLFTGVSLVASYNAMNHIGTLQKKKTLLKGGCSNADFKCTMIKLLTSLQSMQPFVFSFFWAFCHEVVGLKKLGSIRNNLIIATLMCMESFFISIAQLWAWDASEEWIDKFPEAIQTNMTIKMNDPFSELDLGIKEKFYGLCGCQRRKKELEEVEEPLL